MHNCKTADFFNELLEAGFIVEGVPPLDLVDHIFLGEPIQYRYPLSTFIIELTNGCNLRCQHCYGSFSQTPKSEFVPFEWIKQSLHELNALHVRRVGLTGGESTMHPHFLEIATFFLSHGFELCILTNGYNHKIIESLLSKSSQYRLRIKVSLDGLEDIHNSIRGSQNAYINALKTIEAISNYSNVDLSISTVVMRQNIANLTELEKMIKTQYPNAEHIKDLVFPLGNATNCAFSIDELVTVDRIAPNLLVSREAYNLNKQKLARHKESRCTGGITQCTLMPDGFLKICTSACDKQFFFKHNAYSKGLKFSWINCGNNINRFRHEKAKHTYQCKKCQHVRVCSVNDCRVLAWVYTGDAKKSNPVSCFIQHK